MCVICPVAFHWHSLHANLLAHRTRASHTCCACQSTARIGPSCSAVRAESALSYCHRCSMTSSSSWRQTRLRCRHSWRGMRRRESSPAPWTDAPSVIPSSTPSIETFRRWHRASLAVVVGLLVAFCSGVGSDCTQAKSPARKFHGFMHSDHHISLIEHSIVLARRRSSHTGHF